MIAEILGGLGLFLLGMILMSEGLKSAAGDALRRVLERLTGGPVRAMLSGAAITMLVQSSSATTLATIGFVSAGLLTFPQAIGLVFGANLGTTSTGWIVSLLGLKLSMGAIAKPLIGVGALARLLLRGRPAALGLALAGFGTIFVGIDALAAGMAGVSDRFDPDALPGGSVSGRLLLVAIGVAMAVVMQSSSAAVATTLAALHVGTIRLDDAAALVIGQNVGTTVTAAVAAIGASVAARRTALAHILFNLLTGAVAFAILPGFLALVRAASTAVDLAGDAAAIAAFHTSFNLLGVLLLLPFTRSFAAWISRIVPERGSALTRHLDRSVARIPSIALETARRTVLEIAERAAASLERALRGGSMQTTEREELESALGAAREFLAELRTSPELAEEHRRHLALLHAIDHFDQLVAAAGDAPAAAALADPGVRPFVERFGEVLAAARAWLGDPRPGGPASTAESIASAIARERRESRQRILGRTAAGELSPAAADGRLDAVRWVDRVAHDLARAMVHLEATLPAGGATLEAEAGAPSSATPSAD